eukprot:GHRQ01021671.1.p1 GENE.GHRQ01021671.1~~GHRQ01021671.1.p1  ORF type:complete len:120 (-),score=4.36 GHRQ01021671.1:193-552(-)
MHVPAPGTHKQCYVTPKQLEPCITLHTHCDSSTNTLCRSLCGTLGFPPPPARLIQPKNTTKACPMPSCQGNLEIAHTLAAVSAAALQLSCNMAYPYRRMLTSAHTRHVAVAAAPAAIRP